MAKAELPPAELLRKLLRYDADTGLLYWRARPRDMFPTNKAWTWWNKRYADKLAFTARDTAGYHHGGIFKHIYPAHRIIWKMLHGIDPSQIDHVNGMRSDNRLTNLRNVSAVENGRNCGRPSTNTSGAIGVGARGKKWRANIRVDGRLLHLGEFDCFDAAVQARKAAEAVHGFHPNHGSVRHGAGKPGQAAR
jgi:hypothetical protein